MTEALGRMRGGLVVSVQAAADSPLAAPGHLAAIARAVEAGGAVGIRTEGVDAISAIRDAVAVPVIGLVKRHAPGREVYITLSWWPSTRPSGRGRTEQAGRSSWRR